MSSTVIEMDNVWFAYNQKPILEDISLTIYQGDFMGIVGPNGTGKSTLIRLMVGLLSPSQGRIRLLGQNVSQFKEWHRIGYMPQKATSFNPSFPATVQEIVETHLRVQARSLGRPDGATIKKKVQRALILTGMEGFRNNLIGELSGGQQQRVFLARLLVSEPQVMFLDEPLVGIDTQSQQLFCSMLDCLKKELGITILMVTHDPTSIIDRINRLACLERRQLFIHDSQEDIKQELARTSGCHQHLIYHQH